MEATALNRIDLDTSYDLLPMGVMALSADHRATIWNRQMEIWSGVPRAGVINRTLAEVFSDFDEAALSEPLHAVFDLGTRVSLAADSLAIPLKMADGSQRTPQATIVPIPAVGGATWALFAIQDVTDLSLQIEQLRRSKEDSVLATARAEASQRLAERRNEQLAEVNGELEQFAYLASHDLQEPLRTLTSFSTFLQSDLGDDLPETAARDLEHIVAAAARMRRLIDGLLALSRVSRSEMSCSATPLPEVVADALELLDVDVRACNPTILGVKELPTINGDRRLLTQIFQNLLSNAMKFAEPSRPCVIGISAERDGAGWLIDIRDNGIGIGEQYRTKVFAPFHRLHGADKYPGSGMGLAISKRAVERHGGVIRTAPNVTAGSCFQFVLPDLQDQP